MGEYTSVRASQPSASQTKGAEKERCVEERFTISLLKALKEKNRMERVTPLTALFLTYLLCTLSNTPTNPARTAEKALERIESKHPEYVPLITEIRLSVERFHEKVTREKEHYTQRLAQIEHHIERVFDTHQQFAKELFIAPIFIALEFEIAQRLQQTFSHAATLAHMLAGLSCAVMFGGIFFITKMIHVVQLRRLEQKRTEVYRTLEAFYRKVEDERRALAVEMGVRTFEYLLETAPSSLQDYERIHRLYTSNRVYAGAVLRTMLKALLIEHVGLK